QRCRERRDGSDLCGAYERDLPDEPVTTSALDPSRRRLDAAKSRRARYPGSDVVIRQALPLGGYFQLGCDLANESAPRTMQPWCSHPSRRSQVPPLSAISAIALTRRRGLCDPCFFAIHLRLFRRTSPALCRNVGV